jgi:GT2 family glycosyltransferase
MILVAVIVTHNRLHQLEITLGRLLNEDVEYIVIVNNASNDGTDTWLAHQSYPHLHVVTLSDNRGGAGGFEAGMIAAWELFDPTWIVLMDDDSRPYPGALRQFREAANKLIPDTGAVAAAVFYPDGNICEMNRPSRNPFWNFGLFIKTLMNGSRHGFHLDDTAFSADAGPKPIDVASFVGYFVHRDAITRAGFPEGGLFIYGDDVLYSLRLRRAGLGITLLPCVRFEHDCETINQDFMYRPVWKIYYHCRNGVSIARQAAGPIVFPIALAYYVMIWWRRGGFYFDDERSLYRSMMWMGLWDGLRGCRGRKDELHASQKSLTGHIK